MARSSPSVFGRREWREAMNPGRGCSLCQTSELEPHRHLTRSITSKVEAARSTDFVEARLREVECWVSQIGMIDGVCESRLAAQGQPFVQPYRLADACRQIHRFWPRWVANGLRSERSNRLGAVGDARCRAGIPVCKLLDIDRGGMTGGKDELSSSAEWGEIAVETVCGSERGVELIAEPKADLPARSSLPGVLRKNGKALSAGIIGLADVVAGVLVRHA